MGQLTEKEKFTDLVEAFVIENHYRFGTISYKGRISFLKEYLGLLINRRAFSVTKEKIIVHMEEYEDLCFKIAEKFKIPELELVYK